MHAQSYVTCFVAASYSVPDSIVQRVVRTPALSEQGEKSNPDPRGLLAGKGRSIYAAVDPLAHDAI